ncbi:unnamed protein product [Phytophthora lilii]|uniref:Unnamed protein product n=1 Tax=Phytophthora lilii TaxID=2077276 RepID=A0A9W6TWN8_9STRA|nr:unnamed protein product [Phytophthora lilii]
MQDTLSCSKQTHGFNVLQILENEALFAALKERKTDYALVMMIMAAKRESKTTLDKNDLEHFTGLLPLKKVFGGDMELATAIRAAKPKSSTMIKTLQELQFKEWINSGVTPGNFVLYKDYNPTKDLGILLDFYDYQKLRTS